MRKLVFNIRPRRVHKINYKHRNTIETLENKVQINGMTRKEYRGKMKLGTQLTRTKNDEEEEEKKKERIDKILVKELKEDRNWEIRNKEKARKISEDRERKIVEEIDKKMMKEDEELKNKAIQVEKSDDIIKK